MERMENASVRAIAAYESKSWERHILQPSGDQSGRDREKSNSYSPPGETQLFGGGCSHSTGKREKGG